MESSNLSAPRRPTSFGERIAQLVTGWSGSTAAFSSALVLVLAWGLTGSLFRYSDTWQLVMNTASSIVTFLMVFLIQRSQNKDSMAIHIKLSEIVAAIEGASNRIVDVETLSEEELSRLRQRYQDMAARVARLGDSRRAIALAQPEEPDGRARAGEREPGTTR
jgi:low affinity Fe/Cu permease